MVQLTLTANSLEQKVMTKEFTVHTQRLILSTSELLRRFWDANRDCLA